MLGSTMEIIVLFSYDGYHTTTGILFADERYTTYYSMMKIVQFSYDVYHTNTGILDADGSHTIIVRWKLY